MAPDFLCVHNGEPMLSNCFFTNLLNERVGAITQKCAQLSYVDLYVVHTWRGFGLFVRNRLVVNAGAAVNAEREFACAIGAVFNFIPAINAVVSFMENLTPEVVAHLPCKHMFCLAAGIVVVGAVLGYILVEPSAVLIAHLSLALAPPFLVNELRMRDLPAYVGHGQR